MAEVMQRSAYDDARTAEERAAATTGSAAIDAELAWSDVVRLYRLASEDEPDRAEIHVRLADAQRRLHDWPAAATSLGRAAELLPDHAETWLLYGSVLHEAGRTDDSRDALRRALDLDPDQPSFLADMLAADTADFVDRVAAARFVDANLYDIKVRATAKRRAVLPMLADPVFMYWAPGRLAMPPLVRACVTQAEAAVGSRLHLLDEQTWPYYTTLPDHCIALQDSDPGLFTATLGISLLSRYAGAWCEPSCFLRLNAADALDIAGQADIFAFRDGARIATWFLASSPAGYLVSLLDATLDLYWGHHTTGQSETMISALFEALTWADLRAHQVWESAPDQPAKPSRQLAAALAGDGDGHRLHELVHEQFVHRLTLPDPGEPVSPTSLLAALIRGVPLGTVPGVTR